LTAYIYQPNEDDHEDECECFDVNLKQDGAYDFYFEGNIIDDAFIQYYFRYIEPNEHVLSWKTYMGEIIDGDANTHSFNENSKIVLR
jgi:hypothetical protein